MTSINYGEKQREQKSQKEEKEMKEMLLGLKFTCCQQRNYFGRTNWDATSREVILKFTNLGAETYKLK